MMTTTLTNLDDLLKKADAIVNHGDNTTYPARITASYVRDTVRELTSELRRRVAPEARQIEVDGAIATQLARSMKINAKLSAAIQVAKMALDNPPNQHLRERAYTAIDEACKR